MKALVISGGGNKGAFAGGIAEYLIKTSRKEYDLYLGTSTGSLLIPHLSLGQVDVIKHVFTNVGQSEIFSSSPFITKKSSSGQTTTKINHVNIVRMFMKGRKTLGESHSLRQLIRRSLSEEDFLKIKNNGKDVLVTVANLSTNEVEYKNAREHDYQDFCDWVWTSANLVPFMSLVTKNGCEYADGGFGNFVPIKKAIELGATEIDAIILRTNQNLVNQMPTKNALDVFFRVFGFMINQIAIDDIDLGRLEAFQNKVRINLYYIPSELNDNPLVFDRQQMKTWWQQGYEYAVSEKPVIQAPPKGFLSKFRA